MKRWSKSIFEYENESFMFKESLNTSSTNTPLVQLKLQSVHGVESLREVIGYTTEKNPNN